MEYRRARISGGCYFFAVALADRSSKLLVSHIDTLRTAFKTVKASHLFNIKKIRGQPPYQPSKIRGIAVYAGLMGNYPVIFGA